jgi:hypothetical protein
MESAIEPGSLTAVALDFQGVFGNQMVGTALGSESMNGLEGVMATQLGAAVAGVGAWAQSEVGSNQGICRALRHAQSGETPLKAPRNLGQGGSPLPAEVRQRMEAAMGHDFSHVRIHTDGSAQTDATQIHAHAFTTGSHIYFGTGEYQPGTVKGDRLLAHELTHVMQHDEHRLTLPSAGRDVSMPTDHTEVEAYANERRVLSALQSVDAALDTGTADPTLSPMRTTDEIVGLVAESAAVQAAPSLGASGVHRAVENPQNPTDHNPTDTMEVRHVPITPSDGFQGGGSGPQEEFPGESKQVTWEVDIHHSPLDPLRLAGTPLDSVLYTILGGGPGDEQADQSYGEGSIVSTVVGNTGDAQVMPRPVDQALYIGGGPTLEDVRQGGINDCYFLSAVTNVLQQDPQRLAQCIQPAGNNVSFTFWTTPDNGVNWVRETVTTDRTALQVVDTTDPTFDMGPLLAAGVRVDDTPMTSDHYVELDQDVLIVHRDDLYEMAMWAPLLEKAYLRITERSDQYGGAAAAGVGENTGHGYENVSKGGRSDIVMSLFYGPDLNAAGVVATNYQPGTDLVPLNQTAIAILLASEGYRMGDGGTKDTTNHSMVVSTIGHHQAADRLVQLIEHCHGLPEMARYPTLKKSMGQVKTRGQQAIAAIGTPDEDKTINRLGVACRRQIAEDAWPLLRNETADKVWQDLNESLAICGHIGMNQTAGPKNVFSYHTYSVLGANFAKEDGTPIALTIDNLPANLAQISGAKSTVRLHNPHAKNEPNLPSSSQDETEDGVFGMSLDSYLRSFANLVVANVNNTP